MKFAVGVDLGQRRDHTAIAAVERDEYYGHLLVRHIRRVPLGTSYPEVVAIVGETVRRLREMGSCSVAVDATGVGAPVVDMLHEARMGCEISAVTITSGDTATQKAGGWNVPKKDLMAGLQVAMERGELKIARKMREAGALVRELSDMRATRQENGGVRLGADGCGEHDDLVIALALACWRATKEMKMNRFGDRRIPGI